jgi:DNA modification methylase
VVLDCFMGTGATGKAAKKLHRQFIGIEKDASYFERARRGLENAIAQLTLEGIA